MGTKKIDHVLAFYLPQFHPIEENNEWWGKGFTEWTNVVKSKARFSGHRQPQIPSDLGFYDLRLAATRSSQAELARTYGITGFCYYHYWFNGHQLLEKPLNEVLNIGEPNFPFCICWANENWTRAWDGLDRKVLIKQDYTIDDSDAHFLELIKYFKDPRYIKIDEKPLFIIYRYDHIPNVKEYFLKWRMLAKENGFPDLYVCAAKNGFITASDETIIDLGFDAILDFQPNRNDFPISVSFKQKIITLAKKTLPDFIYQWLKVNGSAINRIDYEQMVMGITKQKWPSGYNKFPCIFPSWDNSARRKTPTIIQNDKPAIYEDWLIFSMNSAYEYKEGQRIIFINAWNEWAEGCHLEPDENMGRTFLESTKKTIDKF
ncbi:glycoside hydrolase family 99-like domain-containing protein [Acerihabitans sp. TG2]|uniref:glycosyltransferase WbsX family protein n=1 Tax=Acerihabitans sp. TG2 TaxID=3096008 RepID=UPI002B221AD2|nr:glycoside hydrolase family 99-like domain-containing protein [Acerihabitans sp. TG2]MEA9389288.1 glycoside hydrolase family 99-like domain-containing protein [Acerihabitans sp. TG2]